MCDHRWPRLARSGVWSIVIVKRASCARIIAAHCMTDGAPCEIPGQGQTRKFLPVDPQRAVARSNTPAAGLRQARFASPPSHQHPPCELGYRPARAGRRSSRPSR